MRNPSGFFNSMPDSMTEIEFPAFTLFLFIPVDNRRFYFHRIIYQFFYYCGIQGKCIFIVFLKVSKQIRISDDGSRGVMVEVNIETDFAARNEKFIEFVGKVTDAAFDSRQRDVDALLAEGLGAERETLVQEIGENVTVRRIAVIDTDGGQVGSYLHVDNRKATLVELDGGDADLGRNIAMHVTAIAPLVVTSDDVSPALLAKEREIYSAQAQDSGKPPEIVAKMVDGRIRKYLAEVSLVDQPFVKDSDVKVGELLADHSARCISFVRFEVGEGVDKAEDDFAAEVAAQVKGQG